MWCSGVSLIEYENKERTLSLFKSSMFLCDIDPDVIYTKNISKKHESSETKKCPNCNRESLVSNMLIVPFSYIHNYNTYLRTQTTQNQLKMEKNDIHSYVTPIIVLEQIEINDNSLKKKEIKQLKIGVNLILT